MQALSAMEINAFSDDDCNDSDTIGGYNGLLEKQSKEEGAAAVTNVLFDDQYDLVYDHVAIKKVKPLTNKEHYAR